MALALRLEEGALHIHKAGIYVYADGQFRLCIRH